MQSLKTLSSSISKLKEAATKTVATSKGKPETAAAAAAQKPAPIQQQHQQQKQQTTDDLKAKADALRKQVLYVQVILVLQNFNVCLVGFVQHTSNSFSTRHINRKHDLSSCCGSGVIHLMVETNCMPGKLEWDIYDYIGF